MTLEVGTDGARCSLTSCSPEAGAQGAPIYTSGVTTDWPVSTGVGFPTCTEKALKCPKFHHKNLASSRCLCKQMSLCMADLINSTLPARHRASSHNGVPHCPSQQSPAPAQCWRQRPVWAPREPAGRLRGIFLTAVILQNMHQSNSFMNAFFHFRSDLYP